MLLDHFDLSGSLCFRSAGGTGKIQKSYLDRLIFWTKRAERVLFSVCSRKFNQNFVAQLWYFVKCIYFGLSAYQIRCGYPTRILGNVLTKKYNHLNLFLFQGYEHKEPPSRTLLGFEWPLGLFVGLGFVLCRSWWSCGPWWTGFGQTPLCPCQTGCVWRISMPTSLSLNAAGKQKRYEWWEILQQAGILLRNDPKKEKDNKVRLMGQRKEGFTSCPNMMTRDVRKWINNKQEGSQ